MKIYLDTADPQIIKQAYSTGNLDGVTTNNTTTALYAKRRGLKMTPSNIKGVAYEIADIFDGECSISIETAGTPNFNPDEITVERLVAESFTIKSWDPPDRTIFYSKLPCNSKGYEAMRIIKQIFGGKTNATLGFSLPQGVYAARAGADYFSPFVGRFEANGGDGIALVKETLEAYRKWGFPTKVLFASVRHRGHVDKAFELGCHIATLPYEVFTQFSDGELRKMRERVEPVGNLDVLRIEPLYNDDIGELPDRMFKDGLKRFIGDSKEVGYTILERKEQI